MLPTAQHTDISASPRADTHVSTETKPTCNSSQLKELKITLNVSGSFVAGPKAHCKLNTVNMLSSHIRALLLDNYYFQWCVLLNKEYIPALLTACVSYGIELRPHPDAPTEKPEFANGTTQSRPSDTSSFRLEEKFLSHLTLWILQANSI